MEEELLQSQIPVFLANMSTSTPSQTRKKFNSELTDYSASHSKKSGPYADDLNVDALIVGAGFGELASYTVPELGQVGAHVCSRHLHAQNPSRSRIQGRDF
jgi:hypothetical protein